MNNVSNSAYIPTGICYQHFLNRKSQLSDEAIYKAYGKSKEQLENHENNIVTNNIISETDNDKNMKNAEGEKKDSKDATQGINPYRLLFDGILSIIFCYILSIIYNKYNNKL